MAVVLWLVVVVVFADVGVGVGDGTLLIDGVIERARALRYSYCC